MVHNNNECDDGERKDDLEQKCGTTWKKGLSIRFCRHTKTDIPLYWKTEILKQRKKSFNEVDEM